MIKVVLTLSAVFKIVVEVGVVVMDVSFPSGLEVVGNTQINVLLSSTDIHTQSVVVLEAAFVDVVVVVDAVVVLVAPIVALRQSLTMRQSASMSSSLAAIGKLI